MDYIFNSPLVRGVILATGFHFIHFPYFFFSLLFLSFLWYLFTHTWSLCQGTQQGCCMQIMTIFSIAEVAHNYEYGNQCVSIISLSSDFLDVSVIFLTHNGLVPPHEYRQLPHLNEIIVNSTLKWLPNTLLQYNDMSDCRVLAVCEGNITAFCWKLTVLKVSGIVKKARQQLWERTK